jgi:hypothetical protein
MELIAVATDRKTFEKLQADNAARQQKHRDKKKSLPKPEPIVRDVTDGDDPETSAERRKAEFAALDAPPIVPTDEPKVVPGQTSGDALAKFKIAVDTLLPRMNLDHLKEAHRYATYQHDTLMRTLLDFMRKAS